MASIWSQGSSSSRSSTPQVKAPCDPPPCRARSISCSGRPLPVGEGAADIGSSTPLVNAPTHTISLMKLEMARAAMSDQPF